MLTEQELPVYEVELVEGDGRLDVEASAVRSTGQTMPVGIDISDLGADGRALVFRNNEGISLVTAVIDNPDGGWSVKLTNMREGAGKRRISSGKTAPSSRLESKEFPML